MGKVTIMDHPLIQHKISLIRDKNTGTRDFRAIIAEIAMLECFESTRDLQLEEIDIDYCIIGHSERREYNNETDETCNKKLKRLFASSILPILCVGETLEQRDAGKEKEVVEAQVKADLEGLTAEDVSKLTIAYEPIWAIGTGRTASPEQAQEMCRAIRDIVAGLYDDSVACEVTIQYGGSMKPANATELMNMEDIDGGLIGGASLKAEDFIQIIDF